MNEKRFWDIIGFSCQRDLLPWDWREALVSQLVKLSPEEIVRFDHRFFAFFDGAYCLDLWQASRVMNPNTPDEDFQHFRCWLVGTGRRVYEAALVNPDSLVEGEYPKDRCFTWLCGCGDDAWDLLELPGDRYAAEWNTLGDRKRLDFFDEEWNPDSPDEFRRRFPRLTARYLEEMAN